jgi:hypothetical protein
MAVQCNIGGRDVLAVIDTGAEISLIRRSIVDSMKIKTRESDYDLITLSNVTMDTYGVVDCRVKFSESVRTVNTQASLAVVSDAIFDQSVGALLGMDVLAPLKFNLKYEEGVIILKKKEKEVTKEIFDVRGIKKKDEIMQAAVTTVFRNAGREEAHTFVQDIISRDSLILELPLLDKDLSYVVVYGKAGRFPKMQGELTPVKGPEDEDDKEPEKGDEQ